jgi:hypothetical protein
MPERAEGAGLDSTNVGDARAQQETARRAVRMAGLGVLGLVIAGLLAIPRAGSSRFVAYSLFFEQFARIEMWPLLLVAAFTVVLVVAASRSADVESHELPVWTYRPWIIALLAIGVVAVTYAGVVLIFHRYLLADDEYSAWFQALAFSRGQRSPTVPADWCHWIGALTPTSVYSDSSCSWRLSYLPLHSMLQAPFIALGVDRLGVPLTAGASVWLVASIARKLWPSRPTRAYVAALTLATSTQVLIMSMTMYSMPTHLLFTLMWLWLYVDDRRWANALLPWVGVLAIGVHSPFPHILFIPPFLLRYLRNRRFVFLGYVGVVYAAGLMYWYGFLQHIAQGSSTAIATVGQTASVATGVFQMPTALHGFTTALHLALVPSWNAPVAIVLVLSAMLAWPRLDKFSRDAALSVIVMVVARGLMLTPQGEGWGYRYIYDGLADIALLSAVGAEILALAIGGRRAVGLVLASFVAAIAVQLPLRAWGVDSVISPFRQGYEWMSALPYDVVVYPTQNVQWGRQLVRNDPYLRNRPKIMSRSEMGRNDVALLLADSTKRVKVLTTEELKAHGFPAGDYYLGGFRIKPY